MNLNEANRVAGNLVGYFIVVLILTALWISDLAPRWIPWLAMLISAAGIVVWEYIKFKESQVQPTQKFAMPSK